MGIWSDVSNKSHIMRLSRFIGHAPETLDTRDAIGSARCGINGSVFIAMTFMVGDVGMYMDSCSGKFHSAAVLAG